MIGGSKSPLPRLALVPLLFGLILFAGCSSKSTPAPATQSVVTTQPASKEAAAIIRTARSLLGKRYKWGGLSPESGFDCSGLIWYVFNRNGVNLPRVSWHQFKAGTHVKRADLRPGDLVFFEINKGAKSLHAGIYTDRGTFIHAPSSGKKVMESWFDSNYWNQHYLGARRVL